MEFLLIGAGGHAKAVVEAIASAGDKVTCYVSSEPADWLDVEHIANDELAVKEAPGLALILGIGGTSPETLSRRIQLLNQYQSAGRPAPAIVHPSAYISGSAGLGEAVTILAGAIVQPDARIGRGAIINTGAIVEHDSEIGEGSHIAPGATVLGDCRIGRCCMIGAGAVILPGGRIDDHVLIPACTRAPQ